MDASDGTGTTDIADFYEADERRRESDEVVYGDGWTTPTDPHATYRLSWVVDTGELYTVREPHPGGLAARYLDELDVDQADTSELVVDVLAVQPSEEALRAVLDGWQEAVTTDDSLAWLHARVRPTA